MSHDPLSLDFVPVAEASIDEADVEAVVEVLRSKRLALGPKKARLEERLKELTGRRYALACSSGTAALHMSLLALGTSEGDVVITTPFSFVASANAVLYCRAVPLFVDVDADTLMPSADSLRAAVEMVRSGKARAGRLEIPARNPKGMLLVDVFGFSFDWDSLGWAREEGLFLLEDACEAMGSDCRGRPCGSFGEVSVFGFYPNKQVTAGEGGAVLTDDPRVWRTCESLSNQGRGEGGEWLYYERLGYNYRMDEMSAALLLSQLSRIETIVKRRREAYARYTSLLSDSSFEGVKTLRVPEWQGSFSPFVFVVLLPEGIDRDATIRIMREMGVETRPYFHPPIHLQPFYRELFGYEEGSFPTTESISRRALALPFFTDISQVQQEMVVDRLNKALAKLGHTTR